MSLLEPREIDGFNRSKATRESHPIRIVDNDDNTWIAAPYCHLPQNPFGQHTKREGLWWSIKQTKIKNKTFSSQSVDLHEMIVFLKDKFWLQL